VRGVSYVDLFAKFQKPLGEMDPTARVGAVTKWNERRPVMAVSAGPVHALSSFVWHNTSTDNARAGAVGRFFRKTTPIVGPELIKFMKFVRRWVTRLPRADPLSDVSVETWLAGTSYTEKRKQEIRDAVHSHMDDEGFLAAALSASANGHRHIRGFQKLESVVQTAIPRGIYPRADYHKAIDGPYSKIIEKTFFEWARPWTVKYVPVTERGKFLADKFKGYSRFACTDYSRFEGSFRPVIIWACERVIYQHILGDVLGAAWWLKEFDETVLGRNIVHWNAFEGSVMGKRASGEMFTSLGNCVTNMLLTFYDMEECGVEDIPCCFEGDDGLIGVDPLRYVPTGERARNLGFELKIDFVDTWGEASFCGNVCDEDELIVVTDPVKVLLSTGWVSRDLLGARKARMMAALRAKALSLYYQYNGMPVATEFALYLLRVTRGHDIATYIKSNALNVYQRERFENIMRELGIGTSFGNDRLPPRRHCGDRTRMLVERRYGLSIEGQLSLESQFKTRQGLTPFSNPWLDQLVPPELRVFHELYVDIYDGTNFDKPNWLVIRDPDLDKREQNEVVLNLDHPRWLGVVT